MDIRIQDPGSAITHFIALIATIACTIPTVITAFRNSGKLAAISCAIFLISMAMLYGASTAYHTFNISKEINLKLKKFDHMMISVLIAGSYTPICLLVLNRTDGLPLLIGIWSLAALGILIKLFWVQCPRWFSSVLYIAMGWLCIFAIKPLYHTLCSAAFWWLLVGGIAYTVGGVIYALKLKKFNNKHPYFGTHEIFHVCVMAGSFCHFICLFCYVI